MHVNLHSTVFRTYQHRIYPTLEQKNELDVRFAIEDDFFQSTDLAGKRMARTGQDGGRGQASNPELPVGDK